LSVKKRYWDSTVTIAYLNDEDKRAPICKAILDSAERGETQIFISALTIAETLKYGRAKPIGKEKREKVIEFFQRDYITVVNVDRWIAGQAQELYWENNIPPKDAIHVATALKVKVDVMETYDEDDLIKHSGKVGSPPLIIEEPKEVQMELFNGKEQEKEEPEKEEE